MTEIFGQLHANSTPGEKKLHNYLSQFIESHPNALFYYEPYLRNIRPDFVGLDPQLGIILIEIKDYTENQIKHMPKANDWVIETNGTKKNRPNPYTQLYNAWAIAKTNLQYIHLEHEHHNLITQILVLTNISEDSWGGKACKQNCPSRVNLLFKNNLTTFKHFEDRINQFFPENAFLSKMKFRLLKANLFPITRLPRLNQKSLSEYLTEDIQIELLDKKQEKIARDLGDGHRLIFGVAGSGKTIMLVARVRYLAQRHPDWHILVLCYNKLLRDMLRDLIIPSDFQASIEVYNFHKWAQNLINCDSDLRDLYSQSLARAKEERKENEFFTNVVPTLLKIFLEKCKLSESEEPGEGGPVKFVGSGFHYDAILIDEAQDFTKSWLEATVFALNPETDSLFIACDGIQGIYARKKFRWKEVGINAVGRVKKFTKSYRNPRKIGECAMNILPAELFENIDTEDAILHTKEYAGIQGHVDLIIRPNRDKEYEFIRDTLLQIMKEPSTIIIIFKYRLDLKKIQTHPFILLLEESHIRWRVSQRGNSSGENFMIITPHSAKGLEAEIVIIPELDKYSSSSDFQLLYVAMTRAIKKLILTSSKKTPLVLKIEKNLA